MWAIAAILTRWCDVPPRTCLRSVSLYYTLWSVARHYTRPRGQALIDQPRSGQSAPVPALCRRLGGSSPNGDRCTGGGQGPQPTYPPIATEIANVNTNLERIKMPICSQNGKRSRRNWFWLKCCVSTYCYYLYIRNDCESLPSRYAELYSQYGKIIKCVYLTHHYSVANYKFHLVVT